MAYELDSEMLQRLQSHYGAMADGELLALAAKPEDLTDAAREVLRGEMARRNLRAEQPEPLPSGSRWKIPERDSEIWPSETIPSAILGSGPMLDSAQPQNSGGVSAGESLLGRFHDAIEVGRACDFLEQNEVPFRVEDVAQPRSGLGMYDAPPVSLNLIVEKAYRERAMAILRREMGLFPLQEVEEADAPVDDGTVGVLGSFGRRADAEAVAKVLEEAGVWHRIVADPEGTVENEDAFTLEVKEVDLVQAGEVVEKAMGLPEE